MDDWRKLIVSPETLVFRVVEVIDASALGVALVMDDQDVLLGIVTDGDIRRGILRRINIEKDPVKKIMQSHPITVNTDLTESEVIALMQKNSLHHLPVVDEENKILNLFVLDELLARKKLDNWVVLMVGGLGSRLGALTEICPKPLLPVGGKPILQSIIENFVDYGFYKFYLAINYKAEMIEDYFGDGSDFGVEIRYIREKKRLGTAGALSLLPETFKEPFFVMNGDLLTTINFRRLLDFHKEHKAKATMCVREYDFEIPYGVVQLDDHKIINLDEKPLQRFFVNAGIYVLEPEILSHIPHNKIFDMPDLFNLLIEEKQSVSSFPIREYWLDIGHIEDFKKADAEFIKKNNENYN